MHEFYSSVSFEKLYSHITAPQSIDYFHHPRKFPHLLSSKSPISLLPEATTVQISITIEQFCYSATSYTWNHTAYTLLCLAFFAQHNIFEIHPVIFFFFIVYQVSHCMNTPQFVIFTVSGDFHFDCFQLMLWTFLYKSFCGHTFLYLFSKYLGVELLLFQDGCVFNTFFKNWEM